jgi:hypothetical protein
MGNDFERNKDGSIKTELAPKGVPFEGKTLKDIETYYDTSKIKAEAIKWVKEKDWKLNKEDFMEFHNITEENLK